MNNTIPPAGPPPGEENRPLQVGEHLRAERVPGEPNVLRMKGADFPVRIIGDMPDAKNFRVEILKTYPQIEVRVLADTVALPTSAKLTAADALLIKLQSTPLLHTAGPQTAPDATQIKTTDSLTQLNSMLKTDLLQLVQKGLQIQAQEIGTEKLAVITAASIRQLVRNSGLFLENKLSGGVNPAGDAKLIAGQAGNQQAWDGITNFQLAALLLADEIFSFFDLDDTDEENILILRRTQAGPSFHARLNFTVLGETIVHILPSAGGYAAAVRTEKDISAELAQFNIKGLTIKWLPLKAEDKKLFDLDAKILQKLGGFDITA